MKARLKEKLKDALDILQTSLDVLAGVAGDAGVPGLTAGASSLSIVVKMLQKCSANVDRINALTRSVDELKTMIRDCVSLQDGNRTPSMQDRLDRLVSAWDIVVEDAKNLKARRRFKRFISSNKDADVIAGFVQTIDWSIRNFMIEGMLAIEFALDDHQHIREEVIQHIDVKLDQVDGHLERLRSMLQPDGYHVPPYAIKAQHNCNEQQRTSCTKGTRTDILRQLEQWTERKLPQLSVEQSGHSGDGPEDISDIFWVSGLAGTGKTTIAYTIADRCQDLKVLGASFFCSRDDADCSNPALIFPTIAFQLGLFHSSFKERVSHVLESDPLTVWSTVSRQLEKLIVKPLEDIRSTFPPCVIIIDALDECKDHSTTSVIISAISHYIDRLSPLKFLITSRPELNINAGFLSPQLYNATQRLVLHEVALTIVAPDIQHYLETSLRNVQIAHRLLSSWPAATDIQLLTDRSGGLFIYAATAIKFVETAAHGTPVDALRTLLSSISITSSSSTLLDALYTNILQTAYPDLSLSRLKSILGSIVVMPDALSSVDLEHLLGLEPNTIYSVLSGLHSVISIPGESGGVIRVLHPTFAEFLLDSGRCVNRQFVINQERQHTFLLQCCLEVMKGLKRDMCKLVDPSRLNTDVHDLPIRIAQCIPPYLQYACRHWTTHLVHAALSDELLSLLREFTSERLLFWVEVCSLLGRLNDVVRALPDVRRSLLSMASLASDIAVLISECDKFIFMFFPSISASSIQIYYSALSFTPPETRLAISYRDRLIPEGAVTIRRGESKTWLRSVVIDSAQGGISSLAFSPDGRSFVSGGQDNTLKLWNTDTHSHLATLSGHTDSVYSVTWSCDGNLIASGSDDKTIRLWDARLGIAVRVLEDNIYVSARIHFSPDGTALVYVSCDHTIKVWDVKSGVCRSTLTGHTDQVKSVAFSRDGKHITSCSNDGTIRLWDPLGIISPRILKGHLEHVRSVVFSPDPTRLLSGVYDALIVWNIDTGELIRKINTAWSVDDVVFSDDPSKVIFRSFFTADMMDITTGARLRKFTVHSGYMGAVAYSPDSTRVVSGDECGFIRVWNTAGDESNPVLSGLDNSPSVSAAAFSSDRNLLALAFGTRVEIRDASVFQKVQSFTIGSDRWDAVESLIFAGDSRRLLAQSGSRACMWDITTGAKTLDCPLRVHRLWGVDVDVKRLWESLSGYYCHTFHGYSGSFMLSHDETRLVSVAINEQAEVWNVHTGERVHTFAGHSGRVNSVAFSLDGLRIVSGSDDRSIRVWAVTTEDLLHTCEGHEGDVHTVAFSPDGLRIASGSQDDTARVWDASTGRQLKVLEGHTSAVYSVTFSLDGGCVFSGSGDHTTRVWDAETGACLHIFDLRGSKPWFQSLRFTPDSCGIIVGPKNKAIRLWRGESAGANNSNLLSSYSLEYDGWLFSFTPSQTRRLCWIPPERRNWLASQGNMVMLKSMDGALVILDFTGLQTYLDSLDSERND